MRCRYVWIRCTTGRPRSGPPCASRSTPEAEAGLILTASFKPDIIVVTLESSGHLFVAPGASREPIPLLCPDAQERTFGVSCRSRPRSRCSVTATDVCRAWAWSPVALS